MRHICVGSRELKTRLGSYLRKVKNGATLIVTERGRPIAELRPLTLDDGIEERLYRLATQGLVTQEIRDSAGLGDFRPVVLAPNTPSVSAALLEDREDRF